MSTAQEIKYQSSGVPAGQWAVYGLYDPVCDELRYVGMSRRPVERLHTHIHDCLDDRAFVPECRRRWIRRLHESGRYPYMRILSVHQTQAEALKAEGSMQRKHKAELLNGGYQGRDAQAVIDRVVKDKRLRSVAPDGFHTIREAAELLGVSRQRVHQILRKAKIQCRRGDYGTALIMTVEQVARLEAIKKESLLTRRAVSATVLDVAKMSPKKQAIRIYLAEKGRTQSWLAGRVGITESALSRILSGHLAPSKRVRQRIKAITAVDLDAAA